ncbi:unnamed protein product [Ilex paraguariensis]|uniref:Uncharacterized protein n=1 Tax=Ilex paraguariensis TaxID=185542 RepID=A0ABC8UDX6_9AQUA
MTLSRTDSAYQGATICGLKELSAVTSDIRGRRLGQAMASGKNSQASAVEEARSGADS